MSEIPIGSPPAPPGRHAAPSGWYPDPANGAQERYWDGWQWSRNIRPLTRPAPPRMAPYQPASFPGARTADGVPLAGWWWRVLAMLIDYLILAAVGAIALAPIYLQFIRAMSEAVAAAARAAQTGQPPPPLAASDLLSASDQLIVTVVTVAIALVYFLIFLRWKGATPGKLVCGLRVVPVDQGLSAFTALQRKGIESKLLYFPDENHWVLKPQNSVQWHDTVNGWLKQHIGQ